MINTNLIIDFDSTIIKSEGLEELANISLQNKKNKKEIIQKIEKITNLGMEGKISFTESLEQRIKILEANRSDVDKLKNILKNKISDSILASIDFFKKNKKDIYIFSGGFLDFIVDSLEIFDIKSDHVFANTFKYDINDKIVGFSTINPLSQENGKAKLFKKLNFKKKTIVIGDGWTDYEIKKNGGADVFIAFIENVKRKKVIEKADFVAKDFFEIIKYLNTADQNT